MSIISSLNKPKQFNYLKYFIFVSAVISFLYVAWTSMIEHGVSPPNVALDSIWFAAVKKGSLPVYVFGYGELKPKQQRFLTSPTQAVIEEIYVYPGSEVSKNTIVLRLSNSALHQKLSQAQLQLAQAKSSLRENTLNNKNELLSLQSHLSKLESDLETTILKREAEERLAEKGIISMLEFKRTVASEKHIRKQLKIENRRAEHLKEIHQESHLARTKLIKHMQLNVETNKQLVNKLNVVAGIDGILQTMLAEHGMSVDSTTQLAVVSSVSKLKAELKVGQRDAGKVAIGDKVEINTFGGTAYGTVFRIDPVVNEGRVLVEVDLKKIPGNAKPDLSVEGIIKVEQLENVLFIERPSQAEEYKSYSLFKINSDKSSATRKTVKFGHLSGDYLQIVSGLNEDDSIILSDVTPYKDHQSISLTR